MTDCTERQTLAPANGGAREGQKGIPMEGTA
jgi:hypothetical protein